MNVGSDLTWAEWIGTIVASTGGFTVAALVVERVVTRRGGERPAGGSAGGSASTGR
jgi:hypothetical protein